MLNTVSWVNLLVHNICKVNLGQDTKRFPHSTAVRSKVSLGKIFIYLFYTFFLFIGKNLKGMAIEAKHILFSNHGLQRDNDTVKWG